MMSEQQRQPSSNKLKSFLRYVHDNFDNLSTAHKDLVLQHYSKHALLDNKQTVQSDDWDYISLGILLRTMIEQRKQEEAFQHENVSYA